MKAFMVAGQFMSLIIKLMGSEEGKVVIDKILDAVEDFADPGGRTESICTTIRVILQVPDND